MSGTSVSESSPTAPKLTRTLAIIKAHAVQHRFDIESRIAESGFEIVKERQIAFNPNDEAVYTLFAEEAASLCGESIWVYILERRRAVEVWESVMGDRDPELARISAPDSLRALYGKSPYENAVYGSPNGPMAELQICSIFASSPPLPSLEFANGDNDIPAAELPLPASVPSASSSVNGDTTIRVDVKSKVQGFKARPVPVTNAVPSIQPRMSRAAALRAGIDVGPATRVVATAASLAKTFENVPGHKRAQSIAVASTAPPAIAPRQNRAMALRQGQGENLNNGGLRKPPTQPRNPTTPERASEIFADVPGHKRRQSISVASTAPPAIAPRPTRASVLRTGQGDVPTPAARSRSSTVPSPTGEPALRSRMSFDNVPGHKRNMTIEVPSVRPPSTTPRINRSAALRMAHKEGGPKQAPPSSFFMKSVNPTLNGGGPRPSVSRSQSQASVRLPPASSTSEVSSASARSASDSPEAPTPAAAPRPPSIVPRTNRAALLRAKMGTPTAVKKVFAF